MIFPLLVSFFIYFVCVFLFVAVADIVVVVVVVVVVIIVVIFLPIYFYTSYIQVAGEGTSPFCHSCIHKFMTDILPKVTLGITSKRYTVQP